MSALGQDFKTLVVHNSIVNAVNDLGRPEGVRLVFSSFQQYLYQPAPTA